jgi:chromosome segregation ATPase
MQTSQKVILAVLTIGSMASVITAWQQARRAQALERSLTQQTEAARLTATEREASLQSQLEALHQQLAERGIEPAVNQQPHSNGADDPKRLEAIRELASTQARLSAATASVTDLRNRVSELESAVERLNSDNKRLTASESTVKEDLDSTRRVVQAMEAELKTKSERLTQLETALRKSKEEQTALAQRSTQATAWLGEFVDVNRRREIALTSLQRRYRDLSDQLRSLALRPDFPELSRVQSTVQSAEDDLRQLNAYNVQAQRLTQKLGAK